MRERLLVSTMLLCLLLLLLPQYAWAGVNGWDHVGHGATAGTPSLNGNVYSMHADGTDLYVGGAFTNAGGVSSADSIAQWNGTAWSGLAPLNGGVNAIAVSGGKVYAGGTFTDAGGNADADFLAVWNGSVWAPFCTSTAPGPTFGGAVNALQVIGNTLYVGGAFQNGAAIASADYLLACDLTTGASSSTVAADGDMNGGVYALTAVGTTLYAGGQFINLGGNAAIDHVGAYDGSWHAMGSGPSAGGGSIDSFVRALASDGTNVYVGSDASDIGGIAAADHVARWNGSSWSAMGSSYFSSPTFIYSLATQGSLVFAGGSFQNESGDPMADEIVYWDGAAWHHLGSDGAGNGPYLGGTTALAALGARVFAGGSFTSAGGDTLASRIAQSPIQQPDAQIATAAAGPFVGNGIYNATASKESKTVTVKRGRHGTFYLKVENDGLVQDSYLLHATGHAKGFAATYTVAGVNVTSQVKAGTYATGTLAPAGVITVKLVVAVANSAGNSVSFLLAATDNGVPTDAVKAVVKAG
jgi:hypothetical protein